MRTRIHPMMAAFGLAVLNVIVATAGVPDYIYRPDVDNGIAVITRYDCSAAIVTIPEMIDGLRVVGIDHEAFSNCTNLTSVTIPDGVSLISDYAFLNCTSLTNVSIGNGVTHISVGVFYGCTSLTSVTIPSGVISIGRNTFDGCTNLASITVDVLSTVYSSLDGVLFDKSEARLIRCPNSKLGAYSIPSSVTSIENGAFSGCGRLTSLTMALSVRNIGFEAFRNCSGLISATISDGVTEIGLGAFASCTSLTSVTIPNSVTSIGGEAFSDCTGLASVVIGNSLTNIDYRVFAGCTNLTSVTIPNSVTSIGRGAFSDCVSLTSVLMGSAVTSIEGYAFFRCTKLADLIIGSSVKSIGENAFSECVSLTKVTIPNSVTGIDGIAFYGCTSLTDVSIPSSVTSIGGIAFYGCTSLTSVTIPNSVTSIGYNAFGGCANLSSITVDVLNENYSSLDGVIFDKRQTLLIQYPSGKSGDYSVPTTVTRIGDREGSAFSGCAGLTSLVIPKNVNRLWPGSLDGCINLTAIVVDVLNENYTSLDGVLFDKSQTLLLRCPNGKRGVYTIPNTVSIIEDSAFLGCNRLTDITIPSSVTSIGYGAFGDCAALTSLTIPSSVTSLDGGFSGCTNLTSITVDVLNENYSSLDGVLFDKGQIHLMQYPSRKRGAYRVPNTVTRIDDSAFSGCNGLTSIIIPDSVSFLGDSAFADCLGLTSVYIEGNRPYLDDYNVFDSPFVTIFYLPGTTGWDSPLLRRPTAVWMPLPEFALWSAASGLAAQYPAASGEGDDPDRDGLSNRDEWLAGTDPTHKGSVLALDLLPRMADLSESDRTSIPSGEHAVYVGSVPGRYYGIEIAERLHGPWQLAAVAVASATQTRFLVGKTQNRAFYRAVLLE